MGAVGRYTGGSNGVTGREVRRVGAAGVYLPQSVRFVRLYHVNPKPTGFKVKEILKSSKTENSVYIITTSNKAQTYAG